MKKYGYLILTLIWTAVIFSFSLQTADDSSQVSSGLLDLLMETFLPGLSEKISQEQLGLLHHLIRKCAHFTEFGILGGLSMLAASQYKHRLNAVCATGFCVLAACIDETIQLFSGGRAGRFTDVLLDSAGALAGILLIILIQRYKTKSSERRI